MIQMHVTEDNSASAVSHPFIGRTGFGGMCELGECNTAKSHGSYVLTQLICDPQYGNFADGLRNDQ